MKKTLIGLLALSSISTFAGSFPKDCRIEVIGTGQFQNMNKMSEIVESLTSLSGDRPTIRIWMTESNGNEVVISNVSRIDGRSAGYERVETFLKNGICQYSNP